ncbi:carnitine operon oxidoreductase CaiA [Salmonella enterica subsp. enterica]|uniref:Carnitine operon oxidoreductase CaiA n=1 Tax=Salmonella enterica I TaxID=59201 RepID=A0A379WEW6_SALET|nr:carnitine operon oxidoreductase CaiA [Salmonella enterica subsp. enterica]
MDFNLNDEQELFVAGIRELMASENWEAYFAECDRDSVYPERFVKALADMGIDSLLIPEEHGGLEAGFCYRRRRLDGAGTSWRANLRVVPIAGRF